VHLVIDGDQFDEESRRRGSVHGHQTLRRNREEGHARLYQDYFADYPTYGPSYFRRRYGINYSTLVVILSCNNLIWVRLIYLYRFRMRRTLFIRVLNDVEQHDEYFVQKRNATGKLGLSSLQKVTAAFRMLTY
jgi:hypothetical protein